MNLPSYDVLSAPLWLITSLHIFTLSLHFVAMNFVVGGIIAVLWGKFTNRWDDPTVRIFIKLFPTAMAATITLGVAPLLFLQLVYYQHVYSAAILSGWFWLAITVVAMFSYYFLYGAAFSTRSGGRHLRWYLTLALMGLIYISFVYSSVFSLAEQPEYLKALYTGNQSGLLINPDIGSYIFRWLHMLAGAVTVGGFFVGAIGRNNDPAYKVGKTFFLWGMIIASVLGTVYLISLTDILKPLMRTPAIWLLTLGVLLSFGSLHFFFKRRFWISGSMVFVSLVTMVITRHYVRLLKLGDQFSPESVPVAIQWSPVIIFLICFVTAVALIWYMLKLFFGDQGNASKTT